MISKAPRRIVCEPEVLFASSDTVGKLIKVISCFKLLACCTYCLICSACPSANRPARRAGTRSSAPGIIA
jgi:hypothetical protein